VVVDGQQSEFAPVDSSVPKGTVLGPLMFLIYINDISSSISSNIRLFADDCIFYHIIKEKHDQKILLADINQLIEWTNTWQISFNMNKCVVLQCSRLLTTLSHDYYINDSLLQLVSKHPYLGVLLESALLFRSHLEKIINKATRMLNFLRRNLYRCNQEVRCTAYTHLVRPVLEYASAVWDPYLVRDINSLEMVQRRATRWVTSNYDWRSGISVSSILDNLQWHLLVLRRQISRLKLFYKAV